VLHYLPKYFTTKAIALYIIVLMVIPVAFSGYGMSWLWILFGVVEVTSFFYFTNILTKRWAEYSERTFLRQLFISALVIRVVWVVFSYFFYRSMTGLPFEFETADSISYHGNAEWGAINFKRGNFNIPQIFAWVDVSDMGYSTYLSVIYLLTDNSIIIARLLKAVWGAWMCVLIYKLTLRNFGQNTARIAAIVCMLWTNFIYYTGLHLKETEMIFVVVAFVERSDALLRSSKLSIKNIAITLVLGGLLFTFRTVLGITALFALFTALIFISSKSLKQKWKRPLIVLWLVLAIGYFMGGRIASEVEAIWSSRSENQATSMEWRAKREGGNKFANRMSAVVFAPAIFIIPIPTMVTIEGQDNQQLINGGNFTKDILAFFLFLSFIFLIKNKKWRDASMIEVFMIGYLVIIAFSAFAQSERFHLPAMPFYMILAAYGISNLHNKHKKYFNWYIVLLFAIIVFWNWFKLAGRGLIQ